MPAEFQKVIVIRGRIENHLDLVRKSLVKLHQKNLRIKLAKCHFVTDQNEWFGHRITQPWICTSFR